MSYETTLEALSILNDDLQARYEGGDPLTLNIAGRPKFHILSFTPLVYEEYGFIRNRAPRVAGSVALRAFLSAPYPEGGALIAAGVEAGREGYGFMMDGYNESDRQVITDVARILGHLDFQFS